MPTSDRAAGPPWLFMLNRWLKQPEKLRVFRALKLVYAQLLVVTAALGLQEPDFWTKAIWAGLGLIWLINWWHYRKLSRKVEIVVYIRDGKAEGLKVPSTPDEIEWGDDE